MPLTPISPAIDVLDQSFFEPGQKPSKALFNAELGYVEAALQAGPYHTADTSVTIDQALFGHAVVLWIFFTADSAVSVTLADDVSPGRMVVLVRKGAGNVTASGTSLVKPASASHSTTELHGQLTYCKDPAFGAFTSTWRLV